MKEYFDTEIKPYNDRLKKELGTKIKIRYQPREYDLNVMVWVKNSPSTRIQISTRDLKFYRMIGLVI